MILSFGMFVTPVASIANNDSDTSDPTQGHEIQHVAAESNLSLEPVSVNYAARFKSELARYILPQDSVQHFKQLALSYSAKKDAETATTFILKYISATSDMSILNDHLFDPIKNTEEYQHLLDQYKPTLGPLSIIYVYAGLVGIFLFFVLLFKKQVDRISTLFIGLFVLFHSLFILHLSLYVINLQYYLPHTLFLSTTFSFLYGPLLYFYFRRTLYKTPLKWSDALHLIPSILLLVYIMPFYLMSGNEKFNVMFNQSNLLLPGANTIIVIKIISLVVYGLLILRMYRSKTLSNAKVQKNNLVWQRNMISIYFSYILAYVIYAAIITGIFVYPSLVHLQIVVMAGLVFYVAYISYEQPEIFSGKVVLSDPVNLFKYKKSRLTPSFSVELKEKLLQLLNEEKVFKQNDISLESLSEKLGTNRHNTSQVINEHFGMNFFELINKYRVTEAMEILKNDTHKNLSIIEVAYEVGFNNKVTFNKSFKKLVAQTPTQYILSVQG